MHIYYFLFLHTSQLYSLDYFHFSEKLLYLNYLGLIIFANKNIAIKEEECKIKSLIRLRMSAHDAHYGGNLVDGARILELFGDVATELLILNDGDEGLFKAYDSVDFKRKAL